MTSGGPWSVKGIQPQARETAKIAARRSGMTLGDWLNSAISEQAGRPIELKSAGTMTASSAPSSSDSFERATSRLEEIAQQLASIARRETDSAQYSYGAPSQRSDNDSFVRILNRVESNERQSVEAFSAVNERLTVLGRQFAQATKAASQKPEDSQGFQTLEKAVRNIIEHMEASEKRNRDNFRSLQDRLAEMSAKAQTATSDTVLRQAPAFAQLETRLGELARRVESSDSNANRNLTDLVRGELQDLTSRIDTVRDTAEHLATRAQTAAVQASQKELRAIEERILGLLHEAQSTFQGGANPADLEHLRGEIERINSRIDEARRGLASDQDVRALRQAVEQLSTRVQQSSDSRPLVEMDRRIVELAQRLHDQQQHIQSSPQISDLDRRFEELEFRLAEALQSPGNNQIHEALQQQIAQVSERMDRTEKQISHFETIERAITQLYEGLEQTRNSAKQVAEDAASRVAQQFASMQVQPQQVALTGAPEIVALEQGLHALRSTTESSDHRNQETLVAVHETLEHIVSKLAELETAAIGQRVAAAAAPSVPQAAATEFARLSASEAAFDHSIATPAGAFTEPPLDLQHDETLSIPQQPEPQHTQSIDLGSAHGSAVEVAKPASETDDLIAAARRAAMAAQQKSLLNGISPTAAKLSEEGSKKFLGRFKLPFLNKSSDKPAKRVVAEGPKAIPEIKPAQATVDAANRRRLMLYGTLGLMIATAAIYNFSGQGDAPAPKSMAPATTAPAQEPAAAPQPDATTPPAQPTTQPPTNTQGSLEGGMPSPDAPQQQSNSTSIESTDDILTGSLPMSMTDAITGQAKQDDDMSLLPVAVGSEKLRLSASGGDPKAQFIVASRLLDGKTVTQDEAQAAYWFGKAAATGLPPAQYRLATMYERGLGVERNVKAALDWYERAGALGNVRSMHNAAVIAANNEAGPPDYARAFKWFSLASSHGLKDSQFNLAVLLERGLGTKADPAEAAFWYAVAAQQNDADAGARADLLLKQMPASDAAAIKERLSTWKAQVAPPEANVFKVDEKAYSDKAARLDTGNEIVVGRVQDMLTQLGYNVGSVNGQISTRTTNAIKLFQIEEGLTADGRVTSDLVSAMEVRLG
jgi:localization factor PodJL